MTATHNDRTAPLSAEAILRTVKTDQTLSEISKLVLAHPKIVSGIVQETHSIEEHNVVRNASGGFDKGQRWTSEYRVFIRTDSTHADRCGPDLPNVIRQAFEAAKIEPPKL